MPERALIMLLASAALMLLWEYMALKKAQKMPLLLGSLLIITAIVHRISSGLLGMLGAAYLLWPEHSDTYRMVVGGAGFIGGMWVAAILQQVLNNLLRRRLGYPSRKIEWINGWKRK